MMWLDELKKRVDMTSMTVVAKEMGLSKATISLVINGKYNGNMDRVQLLTESIYLGHNVECPVLGLIPKHKCIAHQEAKHVGSTPQGIQLYKACRSGCPHSKLEEKLRVPIRLPGQEEQKKQTVKIKTRKLYDAQTTCMRLEKQARVDAERQGLSFWKLYSELLQNELQALGIRYNRLERNNNRG